MLNRIPEVKVSDTTEDDSSNGACNKITFKNYRSSRSLVPRDDKSTSSYAAGLEINFTKERLAIGKMVSSTGKLNSVSMLYTAGVGMSDL